MSVRYILIIFAFILSACDSENNQSYSVTVEQATLNGEAVLALTSSDGQSEELVLNGSIFEPTPFKSESVSFLSDFNELSDISVSITSQPDGQVCDLLNPKINNLEQNTKIYLHCRFYHRDTRDVIEVAVGYQHTCIIVENQVECWGGRNGFSALRTLDAPKNLVNPRNLKAGTKHTCVTDDAGPKCWGDLGGDDEESALFIKDLQAPFEYDLGDDYTCASDINGLKCWGGYWYGIRDIPETIISATTLTAGGQSACLLENGVPICWSDDYVSTPPEGIENATHLSVGTAFACAVSNDRITCWGADEGGNLNPPNNLVDVKAIASSKTSFTSCAIYGEDLSCWGEGHSGWDDITLLVNKPESISMSTHGICVIDSEGLVCVGTAGSYKLFYEDEESE